MTTGRVIDIQINNKGTVVDNEDFDPSGSADKLKNAMDGLGTNEQDILDEIARHTFCQRQEIAEAYKTSYGKDLIDELKDELGGDFEDACIALMTKPRTFDARQLHAAICGVGTDEHDLVEIMCSRTNDQLDEIKEEYQKEYEVSLEEDLVSDTSGYFGRLMVSLCATGREQCDEVNWYEAQEDAQKFFDAGAGQWGTDEIQLNRILCLRSFEQLRAIFEKYQEIAGKEIEEDIESEMSGSMKDGFLALVEVARNKPRYFAKCLRRACEGWGTHDADLIRIIATRSEDDLQEIKEEYQQLYEKSLEEEVESECGGDYKRLLLKVVQGNC
ncbi:hypothetical protein FSP39_019774 [Pinctada imbricata]|uniref:Annexin n=1 Tax=Pinctada imbricata TaxID=66713 RepID=A0AA89C212_PINIB|nr:hypothetical protein FSP39_019774 [Pinctada imbricata]